MGEAVDFESRLGNDGAVDSCGIGSAVCARRQVRVRRNARWSDPDVRDRRGRISESGAGQRRVFSAIHNGPLLVFDDPTQPPTRVSTGLKTAALSAFGDAVCVVSFGPTYQLQCLEQATLRELWRADLPMSWADITGLSRTARTSTFSHRAAHWPSTRPTGSRLWATDEFTSFAFFKIFGRAVLTRNGHFDLEWRDMSSGEVIAVWGKRDGGFASNVVLAGENVLVETRDISQRSDGLRLLKVPAALKKRLSSQ